MWKDRRFLDLAGVEHPIVQAPMAGASTTALAIAVGQAGGLASLACALSSREQVRTDLEEIRRGTAAPVNVNFFCHASPAVDAAREARWLDKLAPYYRELGVEPPAPAAQSLAPFDDGMCAVMEELRPKVVSFHFGLPEAALVDRLRAIGCVVIASATTVAEARWLEDHGVDAVIAQGAEAGGHRGMFLTEDVAHQPGTFALVPQVADAVRVPVIAAGGVADARGIVAALALGASAVQLGTAYLRCPEANVSAPHRERLRTARDDDSAITNVLSGRPARSLVNRMIRELGPMSADVPAFPRPTAALSPLRRAAEAKGSGDYGSLWAGQAAALGRELGAEELTRTLVAETAARLKSLTS